MQNLIITLQAQGQGNMMQTITFMGLIFVVFYFFMVRPQQKKIKLQKKYVEELKKGDLIVTTGGIHGKVESMEGGTATSIIISSEGSRLKIEKSAISSELSANLNKA
jgi:preprotein translocase subunit YajC